MRDSCQARYTLARHCSPRLLECRSERHGVRDEAAKLAGAGFVARFDAEDAHRRVDEFGFYGGEGGVMLIMLE